MIIMASQNIFLMDLADREEDVWSASSPRLGEGSSPQVIHIASAASVSPTSSHDNTNTSDDHFTITLDPVDVPFPSTSTRQTTAEEWEVAARENLEGVHYTREKFPSDSISFLAAPFVRAVTCQRDSWRGD